MKFLRSKNTGNAGVDNGCKPPNSKIDIGILVVSCDACSDLWHPFFHCHFKYWPDCPFPVYLGSNNVTYADPRIIPIQVGPDVDYSSNLIRMLERFPHKWVIFWIDDRPLGFPVNTAEIERLIKTVEALGGGYLKLLANHPFAFSQMRSEKLAELPKGIRYRVCMTVALWRTSALRQILQPGESPWQIERQGTIRSENLESKFFALTPFNLGNPPIQDTHLIIKGCLTKDGKEFLHSEGLHGSPVFRRPQESTRTRLYVALYQFFWDLFYSVRYNRLCPWR